MKHILIIFFWSIALISCDKNNEKTDHSLAEKTINNVSYGTNVAQRMDIYLPAGRTVSNTKIIVLIHGGGWSLGDKEDFRAAINTIKQRLPEYAIFNINYRLATGNDIFPAQENDVKNALQFIVSKAEEFDVNNEKIVLLGVSSGAHLALLQAYKHPPSIKAVVDFFGPTDLVAMYNQPANSLVRGALESVTGATPATNLTLYQNSSPINYVSANSPPTLILHGEQDMIVHISQSTMLKSKLQAFGVVHQMIVYPNEGHGWFGAALNDSFDKIVAFLSENVP